MKETDNKKLVIAFEGAGIGNVATNVIFNRISDMVGEKLKKEAPGIPYQDIRDYVFCFAGVSGAALMASILAIRPDYSLDDCLNSVFLERDWGMIKHKQPWYKRWYSGLFSPIFDMNNALSIGKNTHNYLTFGEVSKKVLLTSYNLKYGPTIWTNLGTPETRRLPEIPQNINDICVADAAFASGCFEAFFNAYKVEYEKLGYGKEVHREVDGWNVCVCPIMEVIRYVSQLENTKLSDLFVISFGESIKPPNMNYLADRGVLHYIWPKNMWKFRSATSTERATMNKEHVKFFIESAGGQCEMVDMNFTGKRPSTLDISRKNMQAFVDCANDYMERDQEHLNNVTDKIVAFIMSKHGLTQEQKKEELKAVYSKLPENYQEELKESINEIITSRNGNTWQSNLKSESEERQRLISDK